MPVLKVNLTYTLEVTPEEFRVIQAALTAAGRDEALQDEFRPMALELQNRFFMERNKQVTKRLEDINKHEKGRV
jgi:hypothetical protein